MRCHHLLVLTIVYTILDILHRLDDVVPHVEAQLSQLLLLHQRPMFSLTIASRSAYSLPPNDLIWRQVVCRRFRTRHGRVLCHDGWRRDRGFWRGNYTLLVLSLNHQNIIQSRLSISFAFSTLSLCSFLSLMSLARGLVFSGASPRRRRRRTRDIHANFQSWFPNCAVFLFYHFQWSP